MKRWLATLGLLAGTACAVAAENPATRAIILANADDPDSLRIARHYAEARGVPAENIFAQKMPTGEVISWREFVATVWEPLRTELVNRKWIDAIPMEVTDNVGRKKYAMNHHRIAALVVCRGVPLKISHDPDLYTENIPLTHQQEFRSNAGALDSELALLAVNNYNINAYVPNPLFHNDVPVPPDRAQIIPVGRLDGPTADDAIALIDHALAAERTGLIGRGYVDLGGPFAEGDKWMEAVAVQIDALGFDLEVERTGNTFGQLTRYDAPALYFGWYAGDLNGAPTLPGFQFPAGAIAFHIHSFSASSLRSPTAGWSGPFVAHGVSATVGNVFEPYLNLTHRPDLLLRALVRGAPLGEAALYAQPGLSWQAMLVGDPLYRPFAVSLDEQWQNRASLPASAAGYVALRRMRLLERMGKDAEAMALGRAWQQERPSLALGIALGSRLQKANDLKGAIQMLELAASQKTLRTDEWALAREAAQMLAACGRPASAVRIYRTLVSIDTMPTWFRTGWLHEAANTAAAAQDSAQAAAWHKAADELGAAAKK